ncbi:hypothetical protein [Phocaeicola coprocola]|uniref:hypothetical protein n=1 Tax=Phocaeicola coprocola TaxID=310298 RepID=UPI003AEF805C
MDTIDISQNIQDFKQVFEQEVTFNTQMEKHIRILMLQLGIYKQFRMLVKKMVGEVQR